MQSGSVALLPTAAEACWDEMRRRWADGEPLLAEEALSRWPELNYDETTAVDVIYAEYVLAQQYGKSAEFADYLQRFPTVATALARQLHLHQAMSSTISPPAATHGSTSKAPHGGGIDCPGKWDRYYLVTPLDSGGQAEVFRAVHPGLEIEVVVKIGRDSMEDHDEGAQRILQEGRLLAAFVHPNIARVIDLGIHLGRPFVVMEYVRGRNLEQFAKQRPLTAPQAAELVAKIARALAAGHRQGITHLDVKPRNILVEPSGEPRLIDFGLSTVTDAWRQRPQAEGQLVGTLQFMAPEQTRGESSRLGPATDIFALGGVLYQLLTSQPPYPFDDFARALAMASVGEWDRERLNSPDIPPSLRQICQRALSANPGDRFASADDMASQLESFAAAESRPVKPTNRLAIAGGIGVVALLALIAVGFGWWNGRPDSDGDTSDKGSVTVAAERSPALHVAVWEDDRFLNLHDVVPLRTGDRVQARVNVPANHHATMFLITNNGQFRRLVDFNPQGKPQNLSYPPDSNDVVPLTGSPGTEVFLICCRPGKPVSDEEMRQALPASNWPRLPSYSVVRMTTTAVEVEQGSKDIGAIEQLPSPLMTVRANLDVLRQHLMQSCDFVEAVAFCHDD